jgi:hypothetical protein
LARIDANERLIESVSDTLSDTLGAPSPIPRTEDGGVRVVSAHREPPSAAEQQALRGSVAVAEAEHDQDKQSFRTVRMCLMCGLPYSTPAVPLARSLARIAQLARRCTYSVRRLASVRMWCPAQRERPPCAFCSAEAASADGQQPRPRPDDADGGREHATQVCPSVWLAGWLVDSGALRRPPWLCIQRGACAMAACTACHIDWHVHWR